MAPLPPRKPPYRFHHRLPSTLEAINTAICNLTDFIKEIELEIHVFALVFLCREALNNAVIHGNKMDPDKEVQLDITIDGSSISITVGDEGEGFQWQEVVTGQPVPPDRTSGRGVTYLQQYGYSLHYNERGNILYLDKDIS